MDLLEGKAYLRRSWVLLLEGFRAVPGGASFTHNTVIFIIVDFYGGIFLPRDS